MMLTLFIYIKWIIIILCLTFLIFYARGGVGHEDLERD